MLERASAKKAAAIDGEIYLGTNTGLTEQIYVYNRAGVEQRRITVPGSLGVQSLAGDDTAMSSPSADFTGDGFVTAADFVQWEGDFGLNGDSDANMDGISGGTDFLAWQRQFDSEAGSLVYLQSVPEPSTTVLVVCLAAFMPRRNNQQ